MTVNLQEELHNVIEIVGSRSTYEDRLSSIGIDKIIDLIDMGAKMQPSKLTDDSILGLISVPESRFNSWLTSQPADDQVAYLDCLNRYKSRVKNALIEEQIDIIRKYDEMYDKIINGKTQTGFGKGDKMKLAILNNKAKAAQALLRQLEVTSEKKDDGQELVRIAPTKAINEPKAEVFADESQQAELRQLIKDKG